MDLQNSKKINTDKKLKKAFIAVIFGVLIVCVGILSAIKLDSEIRKIQPVPGFTTLLPGKDICSLALNGNEIWAGGSNGLYKVSADYTSEKVGNFRYIKAVLIKDGKVWIGHDMGVTIYDGKTFKNYTENDGLPDHRVNALFQDKNGMVWAGTWGGVAVFEGGKITRVIAKKDGLLEDMVNVITQDSIGGMWFGNYVAPRGGISILYNEKWQYFTTKDALLHSNINAIINLRDKEVITGGGLYTQGGGTKFSFDSSTGSWSKKSILQKKDGLAGAKIRSLLEDSKKRLWIGSEYEGLAVFSGSTSKILTKENGLSNNEVKSIIEQVDGTIWIGTREGLVRVEKGEIESVR